MLHVFMFQSVKSCRLTGPVALFSFLLIKNKMLNIFLNILIALISFLNLLK